MLFAVADKGRKRHTRNLGETDLLNAFIPAALYAHRRFELARTMACTTQVRCDDVPLKNDGADSLLIILKGAHNILFQVMTAFKFQVMYGLNSKDTKLSSHSNINSSKPLMVDLQSEDLRCARRTWTSTAPVQAATDADVSFASEHRLNHIPRRAEKDS